LAKEITVSFENEFVRVLYVSSGRSKIKVRKALLLKNEEFDDFLLREKARNFIVVADFKVFYNDILYLPPAKDKFVRQMVDSEIRKKNPELKDFSFSYTVLGDTVREGKKVREVFFYAVDNADLFQIIQRFDKYNKTVKYIFPFATVLSRLVNAVSGNKDELYLCITESGLNKIMFLMKDGKIHFIRTTQALEPGIHDIDVHDVNMTVNYCRQTLRTTPDSILLIGSLCSNYDASMRFAIPSACVRFPENVIVDREAAADYLALIAAVLPGGGKDGISVLPGRYARLMMQKKIVASGAIIFMLLSFAGLWYLKKNISEIVSLKKNADMLRAEISQMESNRQTYETLNKQLSEYVPIINFMNSVTSVPDIQKALISLASLNTVRGNTLQLDAVTVSAAPGTLNIQLKGSLNAGKYADIDKHYRGFLDELKGLKGFTTASDSFDMNSRNFHVEVQYSDR
jgi:hypothetical protein